MKTKWIWPSLVLSLSLPLFYLGYTAADSSSYFEKSRDIAWNTYLEAKFADPSQAEREEDSKIQKISVVQIGEEENDQEFSPASNKLRDDVVITSTEDLAATGTGFYHLVKEDKIILHPDGISINVLPLKNPSEKIPVKISELEGWKPAQPLRHRLVGINGMGEEVVNFVFEVRYFYGASWKGHGAYLAGMEILPLKVNVKPGYQFQAQGRFEGVSLVPAAEDVQAKAIVGISFEISSMFETILFQDRWEILGTGPFRPIPEHP